MTKITLSTKSGSAILSIAGESTLAANSSCKKLRTTLHARGRTCRNQTADKGAYKDWTALGGKSRGSTAPTRCLK